MHQRPDGVEDLSRSPPIVDRVRGLVPAVVLAWPFAIPLLTPEDEPCTGSSAPPSFSQRLIAFAFSSASVKPFRALFVMLRTLAQLPEFSTRSRSFNLIRQSLTRYLPGAGSCWRKRTARYRTLEAGVGGRPRQ